jgi:hypothetical protein
MPTPRFKLGVVVLAHSRPEQLATLIETLRHPQLAVYLHIDSGVDVRPFEAALAGRAHGELVWLRRHRTRWGSLAIVDAEIEGISRALADDCSYILMISGEDFPLRPVAEIVEFAQANQERSFVQTYELPYQAWPLQGRARTDFYSCRVGSSLYTCFPRGEDTSSMSVARRGLNWMLRMRFMFRAPRRFPAYLRAFGGQQWLNLSPAAASQLVGFLAEHPDYRAYHADTACPDEILIQSILLGTGFAAEHQVVDDDLRFLLWTGGDHPKTLQLEDLPAMRDSGDLFARKVVAEHDPGLFAALLELTAGSAVSSS